MEKNKIASPLHLLVIGGSAGSLDVLLKVLPKLVSSPSLAIVAVLHRKNSSESMLAELLATRTQLPVREVEDKHHLKPGHIYVAPADYHLLFEENGTLSLDYSEKINYSRPSIDVAFDSASEVFGAALTCLLLSGANADGMAGMVLAKERGSYIVVQDPATADSPFMPEQAILKVAVDTVLKTEDMAAFINNL